MTPQFAVRREGRGWFQTRLSCLGIDLDFRGFHPDVMQRHWRRHHAGDAHEPFAQQQSQQRQPDGGVNFRPDDLLLRRYGVFTP